eukprot:TRINITY_DN11568_c0_g1_i1.p1 TRINITY_DN11568_c0_g1~~TRINITY_DN11568_c0_g1_i1.p1  ORF type:complete len:2249 (+),score=331.38 TRINITY_DN11568_c0_g1_i1:674-6748(+)
MVDLVKKGVLHWRWYWVADVLRAQPQLVLHTIFVMNHTSGSGPRKGYNPTAKRQDLELTVACWGWRHVPDIMLSLCKALGKQETENFELAEYLMQVSSTKFYVTTSQKIGYLADIWAQLPRTSKTPKSAHFFVALLPAGLGEHRDNEIRKVIDTFWTMVADLSRSERRMLLVGSMFEQTCTETLQTFVTKLPVALAVEQFFRLVNEFEASTPAYKFIQSDICKSKDGRNDALMQRVFERYLQKDDLSAVQASIMFTTLLRDARNRDVILTSFDLLIKRLDNRIDTESMQMVVKRMHVLEKEWLQDSTSSRLPKAYLPVPVAWVHLVKLPEGSSPHCDFLLHVLYSDTGPRGLLGVMLAKYGSVFFWDIFSRVLDAVKSGGGHACLMSKTTEPNTELLQQIDLVSLTKPITEQSNSDLKPVLSGGKYFEHLEETKRKTLGKDPAQRTDGYLTLMKYANNEKNPSKAFSDLLPFLVGRFNGEQDSVRDKILSNLLASKLLPFDLWAGFLSHLQSLWKMSSKSRDSATFQKTWTIVGKLLLRQAIRDWKDTDKSPSEICQFGLDISGGIDLPTTFVETFKQCKKDEKISDAAARWVFENAVPLNRDVGNPHSLFWTTLAKLAEIVEAGQGAERALWERWSFVSDRWRVLLKEGVKQNAVEFVLIGVVDLLVTKWKSLALFSLEKGAHTITKPWWDPLECDEYKDAVEKMLRQLESGDIPAKEAASMLARRMRSLLIKETKSSFCCGMSTDAKNWKVWGRRRRARMETIADANTEPILFAAEMWIKDQSWDIPKKKRYIPLPWEMFRCRDNIVTHELRSLLVLLKTGRAQRQVLWQIVEVAAVFSGPVISSIVKEGISVLDACSEGMARCVARHYPYLNAALTSGEVKDSSCDVLTPLLELWLFDDKSRDANVATLMERSDFEYFLFFGNSFARHLSNFRQEWLHRCLKKLGTHQAGDVQFYHYSRRGPLLRQIAQLGSFWRKTWSSEKGEWQMKVADYTAVTPKRKGKGRGKGRESSRRRSVQPASPEPVQSPGSVQMYLWHPDTQTLFLQQALVGTDQTSLALISRLEFADGLARAKELLESFPKEQSVAPCTDLWGWDVIQAAGAYGDLRTEIQRRFTELAEPWVSDVVRELETETLVWSLGRSDEALRAMGLLARFAGKFRQVKEASTKLLPQLDPADAGALIQKVMLPRKSGVGLMTAGLRMIVQLEIADPLAMYRTAWANGKCPRDVAAIVLAKVNTTTSFSPEDVRGFFDFFKQMADEPEECAYVARLLLEQLAELPNWSLPFLPQVVAELAMLPGQTVLAVEALKVCTSHVTEVIRALTKILQSARLSLRTCAIVGSERSNKGAQLLKDLSRVSQFDELRLLGTIVLTRKKLDDCHPSALLGFIDELWWRWCDAVRSGDGNQESLLQCILSTWVKLLRHGEPDVWPGVLADIVLRCVQGERTSDNLVTLAQTLVSFVSNAKFVKDEREAMVKVIGDLFERILDEYLLQKPIEMERTDEACRKANFKRKEAAEKILMLNWAALVAMGCPEVESDRLFKRCDDGQRLKLATNIITKAVTLLAAAKTAQAAASARWRQQRPQEGWRHEGGVAAKDVKVGSVVNGTVTNSSAQHGVFINFGCEKDGKLNVPENHWNHYRVGHQIDQMVVNKIDITPTNIFIELLPVGDGEGTAASEALAVWDVACRTIAWLSSTSEARELYFNTVSDLWASTVALDCNYSSWVESLNLLGSSALEPAQCTCLVETLMTRKPTKNVARQSLAWLGQICPEDAARLWTVLLTPLSDSEDVAAEERDIEALLHLCEHSGATLPEISAIVARGLTQSVLGLLAASKLPEARLIVIQSYSEQHFKKEDAPPALLTTLKDDPCEVVAVAAKALITNLQDPQDEINEKGKGKGKGKGKMATEATESSSSEEESDERSEKESEDSGAELQLAEADLRCESLGRLRERALRARMNGSLLRRIVASIVDLWRNNTQRVDEALEDWPLFAVQQIGAHIGCRPDSCRETVFAAIRAHCENTGLSEW